LKIFNMTRSSFPDSPAADGILRIRLFHSRFSLFWRGPRVESPAYRSVRCRYSKLWLHFFARHRSSDWGAACSASPYPAYWSVCRRCVSQADAWRAKSRRTGVMRGSRPEAVLRTWRAVLSQGDSSSGIPKPNR
jgi:hypothetical protein